jgi:catechol 2,3-dioxygenase-like lactoylglutathione lyase family enzyme
MNLKLEAIVPVSDVDRAKKFYEEALGFRVDVDHRGGLRRHGCPHLQCATAARAALLLASVIPRAAAARAGGRRCGVRWRARPGPSRFRRSRSRDRARSTELSDGIQ